MSKQYDDYRINIRLTLRSPVLSAGTAAAMLGIDSSPWMLEQDDQQFPLLPGTLIRGNLLHSWKALKAISPDWLTDVDIDCWMGQESEPKTNEPQRGALRWSDSWIAEQPAEQDSQVRYRIQVDEKKGTVKTGHLQQIEIPHPVGLAIFYQGYVDYTGDLEEAERIQAAIEKGLAFVPAL